MAQCLQQVVQVVGIPLQEALEMATLTPARIIGMEKRVGSLAVGRKADVILLDGATLAPRTVIVDGTVVSS
jgi:N-acetylglucosamine-6-phosphate deacetylase